MNRWKQLRNWGLYFKTARQHWGDFVTLVVTALLPLFTTKFSYWWVWAVLLAVFFIGWLQSASRSLEANSLKEELQAVTTERNRLLEHVRDIPQDILQSGFTTALNFGQSERISLFVWNDSELILMARHAKNPAYAKNSPRDPYRNQGFIGLALQHGRYEINNLPDPGKNMRAYIQSIQKEDPSSAKDDIESLTMKSRYYYCRTLEHLNRSIGVLVVESLKPQIDMTLIDTPFGEAFIAHLSNVVAATRLPGNGEIVQGGISHGKSKGRYPVRGGALSR